MYVYRSEIYLNFLRILRYVQISTNAIIQKSTHATAIAETNAEDMIVSALLVSRAMLLKKMDVKVPA
jgi:hypothetical protein